MIIHQPEIVRCDEYTILCARIEMAKGDENLPEILWYRVPNEDAEHLTLQSDSFLVPGLLAAAFFGEDIEVRGVVSPRLAYNIEEYKFLLQFASPGEMKPFDIKYNRLEPINAEPKAVGSTFSGGVDSLFTVWQHLPQNQDIPEFQITHGLKWARKFDPTKAYFTKEVIEFARVHKKGMLFWIRVGIILGYIRSWILKLIPGFV